MDRGNSADPGVDPTRIARAHRRGFSRETGLNRQKGENRTVDRTRVIVWTGVVLIAVAAWAVASHPNAEPTVYSIKDQHEDCGSADEHYAALESCLVERYDWPVPIAARFSDAMRERHVSEGSIRPTDWEAFQRAAADLRAVYRALGVRDIAEVELDIYADSATSAFSDSIGQVIRDSIDQAQRRRQHAL